MGRLRDWWMAEMEARGMDPEVQMPEGESLERLLQLDQNRRQYHTALLINMNTDEMEFRYERRGDVYMTKCWYNGNEKTERGLVDQTPEWLGRILAVSRVGNHIRATINPPPDEILWFRTDINRNLTAFIDLEDTR